MAAARHEDRQRVDVGAGPPYLAGLIASSPQLRRDVRNSITAGVSPRRYAGWEPRTRYSYDDQGRISHTEPEPEWDEWDTALVDELLNWQAGVHTCGHHESEQPDADHLYVASWTACKACAALQAAQEKQSKEDEPARKQGRNPDYPRRWRVDLTSRADLERQATERATRKSPLQQMQEALEKLEESP